LKCLVPETPEAKKNADFTAQLIGTLQENLRKGDPTHAAEVFIDMLNVPGTWPKMPAASKEMILTNIYTALGDTSRPLTTCEHLKKFHFPVLLLTGERSPQRQGSCISCEH
jgi:hypothetical protein